MTQEFSCGVHALRTSILESILLKTRGSWSRIGLGHGEEFPGEHVDGHSSCLCWKSQCPQTMSEGSAGVLPRVKPFGFREKKDAANRTKPHSAAAPLASVSSSDGQLYSLTFLRPCFKRQAPHPSLLKLLTQGCLRICCVLYQNPSFQAYFPWEPQGKYCPFPTSFTASLGLSSGSGMFSLGLLISAKTALSFPITET